MATVPIWNGKCKFIPFSGQTPFAFYDGDVDFQVDAEKVARFCASRLGWPLMDVELGEESFYTCFEEAVTTYGNQIYEFKVKENYLALEGSNADIPANDMVIEPSLQRFVEISKNYGTEAGVGGNITLHHGILKLKAGVQDYDLDEWAKSQGVSGGIEIRRIFYEAPPAILRYFDPYAGTGTGIQSLMDAFDWGSYSPGVNFLLMPIHFDMLKIQAIEFNDQVRKSTYSFEVTNNHLRIFPIPTQDSFLRIEYYKLSDKRKLNANVSNYLTMSTHRMNFHVKVDRDQDKTVTFEHRLGTTEVTVQAYETSKGEPSMFIPAEITILDEDTIAVTFTEDAEGYLVIGYPDGGISVNGGVRIERRSCIDFSVKVPGENSVSRIFHHNLNSDNLNIQVFSTEDGKSSAIIPENIVHLDKNRVRITFTESVPNGHIVIGYPYREVDDNGDNIITNVAEVPYKNPEYAKINSVGRQWIYRYTLALAKELLAYIRGKYTTLPIPDSEATLNQQDLLADARTEKQLLIDQLRDMLEGTSRQSQLERKAQETEYLKTTLQGVPMQIYIG